MREEIRSAVGHYAGLPVDIERIADDDDLFELGMTSHATVSLMLALEDAFDLEFPESCLHKSTFQSVKAIEQALTEIRAAS